MQMFRDIVKGWFGKIILAVIVLLFVLLGSEALLSLAAKPKPAAVVNGEEISNELLLSRVQQQKQLILQQYQGQIRADMIDDNLLKSSVLDSMIKRILVSSYMDDQSLRVADIVVNAQIRDNPDFQEQGVFSQTQFSAFMRSYGITPTTYLDEIRFGLSFDALEQAIKFSAFSTQSETLRLSKLTEQKRSFQFAEINHEDFKDQVTLTQEQISEYYQANKSRHIEPEAVRVDYVRFDKKDLAAQISVSEDEVQSAYENYLVQLALKEKRKASHILIEINAERDEGQAKALAESLRDQLAMGADFAELAKANSDDVGSAVDGGALGEAARGDFLPEFEKVMFSLNEGQISEVVQTEYGFHIIKLQEVVQAEQKSFEAQRGALEASLFDTKSDTAFFELEEAVTELAFEVEDLAIFEEEYAKKVKSTGWITRTKGNEVFSTQKQIQSLFDPILVEQGRNSSWIQLSDGSGVIARLQAHRPEATKPLATVEHQIEEALILEKATALAIDYGQAVIAALRAGKLESEATENGPTLNWEQVVDVDRATAKASFNLISEVFTLPKGPLRESKTEAANQVRVLSGLKDARDFLVIELLGVTDVAKDAITASTLKRQQETIARQSADRDFNLLFGWLESGADIQKSISQSSQLDYD